MGFRGILYMSINQSKQYLRFLHYKMHHHAGLGSSTWDLSLKLA